MHDEPVPQPLISIVTPVLNGWSEIERCLASVSSQDLDDHEHLIVDGGSSDGTIEVVRTAQASDPRVRLIEGPDRGQSHAMNKGVVFANARIVGLLNVDDLYAPGALRRAVDALGSLPEPSFLWGGLDVVDPAGSWYAPPGDLRPWKLLVGPDDHPFPVNPAAYFYHRSLHHSSGLYDEHDHYAMDVDFLPRASFHVAQVVTTPEVLGTYHNMPGTKTYEDYEHGAGAARLEPMYERYRTRLSRQRRLQMNVERTSRRGANELRARVPLAARVLRSGRGAPSHHRTTEQ